MKKVSIKAKGQGKTQAADAWVANREKNGESKEPMKRLTIDVPVDLHKRIKTQCAAAGVVMADEIRNLLEKHFPNKA
jgi:predicted membrane GTPase involved in stress response